LAYNGSEESKIRLGADIDCDPEEYKPNYLTRLCPPKKEYASANSQFSTEKIGR
jgi:hypothetical protein